MDFITAVLRRTTHNGFPVLGEQEAFKLTEGGATGSGALGKDVGSSRQGSFQGLILRSQLLVLLAEQVVKAYSVASVPAQQSTGILLASAALSCALLSGQAAVRIRQASLQCKASCMLAKHSIQWYCLQGH